MTQNAKFVRVFIWCRHKPSDGLNDAFRQRSKRSNSAQLDRLPLFPTSSSHPWRIGHCNPEHACPGTPDQVAEAVAGRPDKAHHRGGQSVGRAVEWQWGRGGLGTCDRRRTGRKEGRKKRRGWIEELLILSSNASQG